MNIVYAALVTSALIVMVFLYSLYVALGWPVGTVATLAVLGGLAYMVHRMSKENTFGTAMSFLLPMVAPPILSVMCIVSVTLLSFNNQGL